MKRRLLFALSAALAAQFTGAPPAWANAVPPSQAALFVDTCSPAAGGAPAAPDGEVCVTMRGGETKLFRPPMPHVPWAAQNNPDYRDPGLRKGADITTTTPDNGKSVIVTLHGGIAPGDAVKFSAAVRNAQLAFPGLKPEIVLNSPGGVVGDAVLMARTVAELGAPVYVPGNAVCASACFLIFAAANAKFVAHSAHVGVHSATDASTGSETVSTKAGTVEMARLYNQLHVPPNIIGRMVTTPGRGITWLSEPDLASMGTRFLPAG